MVSKLPHAIVTGVSRGIGRAIATDLLGRGWSVTGTYLSGAESASELAREHESLQVIAADLRSAAGVAAVIKAAGSRRLRALVNNAGTIEFEQVGSFDRAAWQRTFAVNVEAPVELALGLAELMEPGSVVINIASTDALRGSYNSIAYAASKAALLSSTASLANVLAGRGIRVNAVSPGWIDTDMVGLAPGDAERLTPLGRLGDPGEVAEAVAWLLDDRSSFITGANLVVDGGLVNVDPILLAEFEEATR